MRRPRAAGVNCAGAVRLRVSGALAQFQLLGAAADHAAPQQSLRRRGDNAGDRNAMRDDGDIDGEFVAPGEKFFGAVERIDEDEARLEVERAGVCDAFLGHDRDAGQKLLTPAMMMASAASSATVTGERSSLVRRSTSANGWRGSPPTRARRWRSAVHRAARPEG